MEPQDFPQQGNLENHEYEPEGPKMPWAIALWRMLLIFPIIALCGIVCGFVLIGWGPRRALRFWADTMRESE
jgi:hypothetical protein